MTDDQPEGRPGPASSPAPCDTGPIIGHRGAAGHAPENTLAAFRAAAALGVRWVEFDVRLSRDRRPVVFHDERLERTTGARGRVADRDAADLVRLDAGVWFAPAFAGEPIPTLERAVGTLAALGLGANVEIKPDPGCEAETGAVVARWLAAAWPAALPPPLVSSFQADTLRAVRLSAPKLRCALLVRQVPDDWSRGLAAAGCGDLHCAAEHLDRATATRVRAAGVPLRCYTVNDAATARRLFAWGVDAVFSDVPDRLRGGGRPRPRIRLAGRRKTA